MRQSIFSLASCSLLSLVAASPAPTPASQGEGFSNGLGNGLGGVDDSFANSLSPQLDAISQSFGGLGGGGGEESLGGINPSDITNYPTQAIQTTGKNCNFIQGKTICCDVYLDGKCYNPSATPTDSGSSSRSTSTPNSDQSSSTSSSSSSESSAASQTPSNSGGNDNAGCVNVAQPATLLLALMGGASFLFL